MVLVSSVPLNKRIKIFFSDKDYTREAKVKI